MIWAKTQGDDPDRRSMGRQVRVVPTNRIRRDVPTMSDAEGEEVMIDFQEAGRAAAVVALTAGILFCVIFLAF